MSDTEQKRIFRKNLGRLVYLSGKSQREIAADVGVSPQTFNTWIQGIAIPRMGKIQTLADYFKVEKSDLIDEKEPSKIVEDEARDYANFLHDNPEYGVLFDASRKIKKEDIDIVRQLLDKFKEDEE